LVPGASSAPFDLDRDLGLDRLVELYLVQVEVLEVAAHRVALLLLDHHRHGAYSLDIEVEQGVALGENGAGVALGDLKRARLLTVCVDDAGHEALAAQAAALARAELAAGARLQGCSS